MVQLIFLVPCLYVLARFLAPLPWSPGLQVGLGLLLVIASQYHRWSRLSSGSVFAPEFPRSLIILFNWGIGTILLIAAFQFAIDVGAAAWALATWSPVVIPAALRYAMGVVAVSLAGAAVWQALRVPPRRDVEVTIAGLAPAFEGYRILHLTDLHLSRLFDAAWAARLVERANRQDADLVAITGDFIDGAVSSRRADIEPLRRLTARDGVCFVPGNHEYFFDYDAWMRELAGLGLKPLANAHQVLRRGEAGLVLAGVTDGSARATGHEPPDLDAALAGAPERVPIVLLDHQPRRAREAARRGVALQLSGHTHGGMIRGLDRLVARANAGFVSGRYRVGAMTLYVSNGTALWPGFALRLGRPSELTVIRLRSGPEIATGAT